jgi:DNA primase
MSTTDDIKARLDIVDIVSETVKLRRSGKNYTGFCPFHDNKRTPAFVVFPDSGTWRCFGLCNDGGDIFSYVMKREGWDFNQALQMLAKRAGIELEAFTPEKKEQDEKQDRLRNLLEEAVVFYRHNLLKNAGGKPALEYLLKRGLTKATIEIFDLGCAPDSWDAALNYLLGKGYTPDEMLQVGLVTERRDDSGVYDRFRDRIMFPIRDSMGRMSGFGARTLDPEGIPKYLNSPQTNLFDKGQLLYGFHLARKNIRSQNQAVIVEGYMDVIGPYQAGYHNLVSPMGTALTEHQLRMLKRYSRRIILALDADAAGAKATMRGLEVARQTMDRSDDPTFDAKGLLRREARLKADLRVTTLPDGTDPDEIALSDPEEWGRILDAAQPIVIHVMETLAAAQDIDDPKVKSDIAGRVLPLIEDVPNAVEREAYRQRLARMLRVDERSLIGTKKSSYSRRPGRKKRDVVNIAATALENGSAVRVHSLEAHSLRLLLRQPEALYKLDRTLQEAQLSRFAPQDYENAEHQLLARLILESLDQDQADPPKYIAENIPESLLSLSQILMAPLEQGEPNEERLTKDLINTIIHLRQIRVMEGLNQLRYLQEDLQQHGENGLESYNELVLQHNKTRAKLDRALARPVRTD